MVSPTKLQGLGCGVDVNGKVGWIQPDFANNRFVYGMRPHRKAMKMFVQMKNVVNKAREGMLRRFVSMLFICVYGVGNKQALGQEQQSLTSIYQAAKTFAIGQFDPPLKEEELTVGKLESSLFLNACKNMTASYANTSPISGRTRIAVECVEPQSWTVVVPVQIKRATMVVVSTKLITRGAEIKLDDIELIKSSDVGVGVENALTRLEDVQGNVATQSLAPRIVIRKGMVQKKPVIVANSELRIQIRGEGFLIESRGIALHNANEGEKIRVRIGGRKFIEGICMKDGSVYVGN